MTLPAIDGIFGNMNCSGDIRSSLRLPAGALALGLLLLRLAR